MACIATIGMEEASDNEASKVHVVSKYLNVFLEELPGLPPNKEIKFTINLTPGIESISITLYCMALVELKTLKEQL